MHIRQVTIPPRLPPPPPHHHLPLDSMRPPQFGAHLKLASGNHHNQGGQDSSSHPHGLGERDNIANALHSQRNISPSEANTRTCYHSSRTGDALCVHVPFCVRHSSIVYMSDTLRCAAFSDRNGKVDKLSMGRCVELERDVESAGEIETVEHKAQSWLHDLENNKKILWFEGDTVFIRMSARCKSVPHFADRIFMLHHLLQHPERYGMGAISNVVIAADEDVARKIRYTKSWHHGLLAAIVYPNKLIYSHKEIRDMVPHLPSQAGQVRVFIPSGMWNIAKGKLVPCFRRAALPGSVRKQFFLSEDVYPGEVKKNAVSSDTRYHDADVFRALLFQSLGYSTLPRVQKRLVYLHRPTTRSFTAGGVEILESKLREVTSANGFSYELVDVTGKTFPQQIEGVAGVGVVVGIHGTQMLNGLFLGGGAAMVEIFPYRFSNTLFRNGSGAGVHYAKHEIVHGEEFAHIERFDSVEECLHLNADCRAWYQSDNRKLDFGMLDAAVMGELVEKSIIHVKKSV